MAYTLSPVLNNITAEDLDQILLDVKKEINKRKNSIESVISVSGVQELINSKPTTIGVNGYNFSVSGDEVDGTWVNLDFNIHSLSGAEKSLAVGALSQIVSSYNGQWVILNKTVRVSKNKAVSHLEEMDKLILVGK